MAIETHLNKIFSVLEVQKIHYVLLRGFDELSESIPIKEIDLLVEKSQLSQFAQIVIDFGFVSLPPWGYEPHHFFVNYYSQTSTWLKFDVVTDLLYGNPIRWLRGNSAGRALLNRKKKNNIFVLSESDESLGIFLHCILDKGRFSNNRKNELKKHFDRTKIDPLHKKSLQSKFENFLPRNFSWQAMVDSIENERWEEFLKYHKSISKKIFWSSPLCNLFHYSRGLLMRYLRPFFILFSRKYHGIWIALMAPDGAGKTTLAKSLLSDPFLRAKIIYMGTNLNAVTLGFPTTLWLKNRLESLKTDKKNILTIIFRTIIYLNKVLEHWYRVVVSIFFKLVGCTVIFDRFIYDKYLVSSIDSKHLKLRRRLLDYFVPEPELVFFLDAPGEVLYRRKGEHSPEFLEKQRQTFLKNQSKVPNLVVVDATCSVQAIHSQVLESIWKFYSSRLTGDHQ